MQLLSKADIALLRAALLDGDAAIEAFQRWRSLTDFEGRHSQGQLRMLPLLHANLSCYGVTDALMPRLRGVHRQSWVEGQLRRRSAAAVIRILSAAGIPTMLTKGMVLALDYYPDPSLRPMQDIDVLVPRESAVQALRLLENSGWSNHASMLQLDETSRAVFMARHPGVGLSDGRGNEIDLHWYALHECSHQFLEDWFWQDPQDLVIDGVASLQPCPTVMLLHVISHGLRPNLVSPLRWAADATMILRRAGAAIDWHDFWRVAHFARLERRLAEGLESLTEIAEVTLPEGASHRPATSFIETLEHAAFSRTEGGRFSRKARWLLFVANTLRFLRGADAKLAPQVAVTWLRQ